MPKFTGHQDKVYNTLCIGIWILAAVYDAMYNIDWSDDVATENVKEQFATLRHIFEDKF